MRNLAGRVEAYKGRPPGEPLRASYGPPSPRRALRLWAIDDPMTILAMVVGLIFAIFSLPADVEPPDALRVPVLFFTLSLCVVPVLAAFRDPKSIFRAEHVLVMAPVYWLLLDPLQGRSEFVGVDREHVQRSFIAIALFVLGAWIAFLQRPWRTPKFIRSTTWTEFPTQAYFGIGVLAFALAFLRYAIPSGFDLTVMAQGLAGGRWEGAWSRGALGGSDAFLDHLTYFGYLLPPLTVLLARRLGWSDLRTLCLGMCTLILSAFLVQSGGRRLVGMFFGSGILVWFLGQRKVRLMTALKLGLLVVGLLFTLERMLDNRRVGLLAASDSDSRPGLELDANNALVRVDDNLFRLAQTTTIFPELQSYTTWRYVLWVAARPVPRLLWPGKPLDPGFDLSEFVGVRGVSLSSSVIGELFMAGGFVAVVVGGWFYGRLARSLSYFLSKATTSGALLIYAIGLFALFTGVRSMIELVLTSYVALAWVALVRVQAAFQRGGKRGLRLCARPDIHEP
jgi:hypothetical protein